MTLSALALTASAVGAGASVYSSHQQAKTAENAAEFNAEQTRNASKVKAGDDRGNLLRRQEGHRKYLAGLRARMLESSDTIEGGAADFLDESTGNLQLRILDNEAASNRQQAGFANRAFQYDHQAAQIKSAGPIRTATAALSGFNSVYSTGRRGGFWGQPKRIPSAIS